MTNEIQTNAGSNPNESIKVNPIKELDISIEEARIQLTDLTAEERLLWASKKFGSSFVLTTSFGIQSAVLLKMTQAFQNPNKPKIIWVDTGYLPAETYSYAEALIQKLDLDIEVAQSNLSPARMEALYGKLWEKKSKEALDQYHHIRKIEPLESTFQKFQVKCWGSGVRSEQTNHRSNMTYLDTIRGRLSLRPLLKWSKKDIFYYMQENDLPQHPLFEKGYSSIGDWHSSSADNQDHQGRETRFGGLQQECGIHLPNVGGDGI